MIMHDVASGAVGQSRWTAASLEQRLGRALIALLFILAGIGKIIGPEPFLAHMAAHGVPGLLLPVVIALEVLGGLAVLTGVLLRPAATALACFSMATAIVFHLDWADHVERTMFFKDIAIAGGLFALAAAGRASAIDGAIMAGMARLLGR
jgi:putative oxidoreductase